MVEDIDKRFEEMEQEIFDELMERNPTMATHFGIHEYDHLFPDITREKHLEDIDRMEDWMDELEEIDDEDLSEENRMAKKLGLHLFDIMLFQMKELRQWEKNPSLPETVGSGIFPMIRREYAPYEERLDDIKSRIEDIPEMVEQEKDKLEEPIELWIDMALESAEQLPMLFKLVLMIGKQKGIDEEELLEVEKVIEKADDALDDYEEWLEQKKRDAVQDYAIGEEKLEELLDKRELGYSSQEILEMGETWLDEAKQKMEDHAEEIDPDKDVEEVVGEVMSETPDSFEEALNWYREGLDDAKQFVVENDLATIPEDEDIEVTETPEYLRPIIPFAAYMSPAKFDEVKKGIYLVTPPENEEKLSNYSYWDVRNTTVHEGYPGHHLQMSAAQTNDHPFRLFSHAVETIEGWAHYCEEIMKDMGFDDTPEARLIQTRDVVWRAARIVVDVKLSRGKMSFDEAVDFLVDNVSMEEKDAISEVKRYTQNPAYQLSYLLGKNMIKELKEDVKEKMGDGFTEKFFHDTLLYAGSVPMKYLEEIFENKIEG